MAPFGDQRLSKVERHLRVVGPSFLTPMGCSDDTPYGTLDEAAFIRRSERIPKSESKKTPYELLFRDGHGHPSSTKERRYSFHTISRSRFLAIRRPSRRRLPPLRRTRAGRHSADRVCRLGPCPIRAGRRLAGGSTTRGDEARIRRVSSFLRPSMGIRHAGAGGQQGAT